MNDTLLFSQSKDVNIEGINLPKHWKINLCKKQWIKTYSLLPSELDFFTYFSVATDKCHTFTMDLTNP